MIIIKICIVLALLIPMSYLMLLAAGDISNDIRRQEKLKRKAIEDRKARLRVMK